MRVLREPVREEDELPGGRHRARQGTGKYCLKKVVSFTEARRSFR